jgi:hypothetical protein
VAKARFCAAGIPLGQSPLLDKLMGNASVVDPSDLQEEFSGLLANQETVEHAYKLERDLFLFTNIRLLLVDKQGITGKKLKYHSIPYSKITHYSVETAGHFDREAELLLWISGMSYPIRKQFNKKVNIYDVQAILTSYVASL